MSRRLTRQDWIGAALREMGERGVSAVSVEPLARSLGATKGSFYWHFRNRDELVTEALALWEHRGTEAVISTLDSLGDPRSRLRHLLEALFLPDAASTHDPEATGTNELRADDDSKSLDLSISLSESGEHPAVATLLARVTERRVAYVTEQIEACGVGHDEARRRAFLAYTSYLGHSSLGRTSPQAVPAGEEARRLVASMVELLTRSESPR